MAMTTMLFHFILVTFSVRANGYMWQVAVYTGTVPKAGTDGRISVMLIDGTTKKSSPTYFLRSDDKDNMEKNSVDTFDLLPKNPLSNLTRIRVQQYGSDGWFMAYMIFTRKDKPDKKYVFNCHCWFDDDRSRHFGLLSPGIKPSCDWEVHVLTGNQRRSGTDNLVYVEVYGNSTWSANYRLDTGYNDFERGLASVFHLQMKCFSIEKIKVIFKGQDDTWFPYTFTFIRKDDRSLKYLFPCYQWFDDGRIMTLNLVESDNDPFCDWVVTTYTGKEPRADTDSSLYIELFGNWSSTAYYELETSVDNFEWGKKDVFRFQSQCLTPIRVNVSMKGDDGWYLEHIEIWTAAEPDRIYVFPCHCWLDNSGSVGVDIMRPGEKKRCEWVVKVTTGTHKYAGTDDEVRIQIMGNWISTVHHRLNTDRDDFEMSKTDVFLVRSKCIIPEKVNMKIGGQDAWLISKVELQRKDDMRTTYVFSCHCWLDNAANKDINDYVSKDAGTCMWWLLVWTGTLRDSSTNAKVFLEMAGDGDSSDVIQLNTKSRYLKSGARDEFHFNSRCMTPKQMFLTIDRDNPWFLEWMQIYRTDKTGNRDRFVFPCYCWLVKKAPHKINAIGPYDTVSCDWHVHVWTSVEEYSETHGDIYIKLISNTESTTFYQLNYNPNKVERGSKNEYLLTTRCFIPNQIQIKVGKYHNWGLQKIELTRTDNMNKHYPYICDCRLQPSTVTPLYVRWKDVTQHR